MQKGLDIHQGRGVMTMPPPPVNAIAGRQGPGVAHLIGQSLPSLVVQVLEQKGGHRVVPPGAAPIQFPAGRVNEGQGRLTEGQLLKLVLRLGISLGNGALRLFSLALALVNSRKGFLLIDEAENGIHYLIQEDYWRMVLQTAQENNVQVIATTHSWDCIRGFAQAASDLDDVDGILVRLERGENDLRAVQYSEDELKIAAEQGIEVR